jgi:hypothetical protein
MRRFGILLAVVVMMFAVVAPAAADQPVELWSFTIDFDDVDPCTGEDQTLTMTLTGYAHVDHRNNSVDWISKTGTADTGYVLLHGRDHSQTNKNVEVSTWKDVWRNPDTGAKMHVYGSYRLAGNSPVVDEFVLRCIGAPTILS